MGRPFHAAPVEGLELEGAGLDVEVARKAHTEAIEDLRWMRMC
jgi:hypothetical protein